MKSRYLIPILLFLLGVLHFSLALFQTDYANGWDSYYYLKQIRTLLDTGSLHSFEFSTFYLFLGTFAAIIPNDAMAYKLLTISIASTFVVSIFFLAKKLSNQNMALLIASILLFSPTLVYFASQFGKNLLGLIFFSGLVYHSFSTKKWLQQIIFLILCLATHKFVGALALLYLIFQCVAVPTFRSKPYVASGFLIAALGCTAISGMIAGSPFQAWPTSFHWHFVQELNLTEDPIWLMESLLSVIILVLALSQIRRNTQTQKLALMMLCVFLLFPFLRWESLGFAYRFFVTFMLIVPLLLSAFHFHQKLSWGLALIFVVLSFFSWRSYNPKLHDPPYAKYEVLSKRVDQITSQEQIELILAHKGLSDYLTYELGIDVMAWGNDTETTAWRLVYHADKGHLKHFMEAYHHEFQTISPTYLMIEEKYWQLYLQHLKADFPTEYERMTSWRNPVWTRK